MSDSPVFHDYQAEMALLSCLITDKHSYIDVGHFLKPSHLYIQDVASAYSHFIASVREAGEPPDFIAWQKRLTDKGIINPNNNILLQAINAFPIETPLPSSIKDHAHNVIQAYKRRRYKEHGDRVSQESINPSIDIDELGKLAQSTVLDIEIEADTGTSVQSISDVMHRVAERVKRAEAGDVEYLKLGFTDLDNLLDGVGQEAVVLMAARPGMGKTSLMLSAVLNTAMQGMKVLVFSLEMSAEQLGFRLLAALSKVPAKDIAKARFSSNADKQAYLAARKTLSSLTIFIDDTPAITPTYMRTRCRKQQLGTGLDLVMVDYLQLMESEKRHNNLEQETTHISRTTKGTAKLLKVPIIALAQLSRDCEKRKDKRPLLSDLRSSGSLEQDADVVMFIYRDDYYNPDTSARPNIAEINIAKNREGPTGTIDLYWNGKLTTFKNLHRQSLNL